MSELKEFKSAILIIFLAIFILMFWSNIGFADPSGSDVTLVSVDTGPTAAIGSRQDPGGSIVTINLNTIQQNPGWKAYVGNITGRLVLRNANSQSIYEWLIGDSSLGGNIFVSRNNSINWSPIRCANTTEVYAADARNGFLPTASDSINSTFNNSVHKSMTISGIGTIVNSTCRSIATYVNNTLQERNETAKFQEILLSDRTNLVYATFIDQDSIGFDENKTYDFQMIIAENKTSTIGTTYYFYADIS